MAFRGIIAMAPAELQGTIFIPENGGRSNYGIELNGSAGEAGNEIIIANNSVEANNQNSLCYGLAQSNNCSYIHIFHNLLFISGGSSSGSTAYQTFVFDGTTDFYNNILVSNSEGSTNRCIYIANQSGMAFIDYNCYFTLNAGSNFTGYFGGVENDFASYISSTGELYSLNLDPQIEFIEGKGWRATSENLLSTALFVENFGEDIDGNLRPDPPCIGANEVDQLTTEITHSGDFKWYAFTEGKNVIIGGELKGINQLFIVDLNGRLIKQTSVFYSEGTVSIPLSDCASGIYLLGLPVEGRMEYRKIVIP
ncbi:MAG: T9SS type A sorting domain-containing protein [Bacteroidia bacterium]